MAAGADTLAEKLTTAARDGGWDSEILPGTADELIEHARAIKKADAIFVAGGDGTIAALASVLADNEIPFAPLPCGTMNLFCRDLGLPADPVEALTAALAGAPMQIDIGFVETAEDGRQAFLNNIVFGPYAELAEARERLRSAETVRETGGAIIDAASALANAAPQVHLVTLDGASFTFESNTLIIANNCYTECIDMAPRRARLDAGILSLYLVKSGGAASFAARLVEFLNGTLENSEMIDLYSGRHCIAALRDGTTVYSVDGERRETEGAVDMRVQPGALRVLIPKIDPPPAASEPAEALPAESPVSMLRAVT